MKNPNIKVRFLQKHASDNNNRSTHYTPVLSNSNPDETIQDDLISSRLDESLLFPDHSEFAFGKLSQTCFPRYWLLRLVTWPFFEKLSMFIIIINCITMGMFEPCTDPECASTRCVWLEYIDHFIYFFFLIEMLIKIFAMGLVGKKSYLSEPWNRLDCFIVCAGAIDYLQLGESSGIKAIRTIRVLRPLRAINRVPSLRILVTLIIDTLPMLGNIALLSIIVLTVFGIVGVQLWKGMLRNRCFSSSNHTLGMLDFGMNGSNTTASPISDSFFELEDGDFLCTLANGMQTCNDVPYEYKHFSICKKGESNPAGGSISFDNILYSLVMVFQVTTQAWTPIMYMTQDAHTYWTWTYFVLLIIIGAFFLLNMVLVIIFVQFAETRKRELERMKKEKAEKGAENTSKTNDPEDNIGGWESFLIFIGEIILNTKQKLCGVCSSKQENNSLESPIIIASSKGKESARNTTTLKVFCCCCFKSLSNTKLFKFVFDLRDMIKKFVDSPYFGQTVLLAILINSIFMAIEHHNQADWLTQMLEYSNYFFTAFFILELLFKWIAYGIYGYIKDPMNLFDGFIVAISIVELFAAEGSSGITVLRTFRLLRIFKAFRFIPLLRKQIYVMLAALDSVASFGCLFFLFIFIFSVLGMHLFGCNFYDIEDGVKVPHRVNFDSLFWAMITVFQILTGDGWEDILYTGMETSGPWSSLYFITLIIFGNYVLLSLLVAILVDGFSEDDDDDEVDELKDEINDLNQLELEDASKNDGERESLNNVESKQNTSNHDIPKKQSLEVQAVKNSCFCLNVDNKLRIFMLNLVNNSWFKQFILITIFFCCITMAMERPSIQDDSLERKFLTQSNLVFSAIFFVEMIFKIIAFGFIRGKDAYLRNSWNIIDFFLVVVSLVDLTVSLVAENDVKILSILKILRLLRTLRPLRAINNAPGLKLVVDSLLSSIKPIGNTVFIVFVFLLIFAILGVQLFSGTLYHCSGEDLSNITTKNDCLSAGYEWENSFNNYDDIVQAFFTLFVIGTMDDWVTLMHEGIDSVGVDMQPVKNNNKWMAMFYISYLMVVGFYVINMFIGVVVDNFHKCRDEQLKLAELNSTKNEEDKSKQSKQLKQSKSKDEEPPYYTNYSPLRLKIHDFVCNAYFDLAISAVIILNILVMAIEFDEMPEWLEFTLEIFNYIFTVIFILEAIIRIVALGFKNYFKDGWNNLDMFIVIASIVSIIITFLPIEKLAVDPTIIRSIRIIRVARIFKLFKKAEGLQTLLFTVGESLPQVGNLGLLFGILFFIFSTLGVELFGKLTCDSRLYECEGISKHANFNNFGAAFLTLFRVTTGDAWSAIMRDTRFKNAACATMNVTTSDSYLIEINTLGADEPMCINSLLAPVFFITFVLVAQFVLMNIVIAVIMKQLEDVNSNAKEEEKRLLLEKEEQTVV